MLITITSSGSGRGIPFLLPLRGSPLTSCGLQRRVGSISSGTDPRSRKYHKLQALRISPLRTNTTIRTSIPRAAPTSTTRCSPRQECQRRVADHLDACGVCQTRFQHRPRMLSVRACGFELVKRCPWRRAVHFVWISLAPRSASSSGV